MKRRTLAALAVLSTPIALFACAQRDDVPRRRAAAAYPNPTVDALATTSGTSGTFVVPSGAYVTSWWAHAAAGGAGGTVTIAPSGPGSYPTCYASDASTCRDAGPSITIPAGVAFSLEIPTLKGGADELGAGSVFVFAGTDSFAITVNGPGGSGDAAAPPTDAGASDAADAGVITITSVTPNDGTSAGGWTTKIQGAGMSLVTTAAIGGVSASFTYSTGSGCLPNPSQDCITVTEPANSSGNGGTAGNSTGLPIALNGTNLSSGDHQNFFYLDSTGTILFHHRGDVGVVVEAGTVSQWADLTANGINWAAAGALEPGTTSSFNDAGVPALTFNGTTQFMANTSSIASTGGFLCSVGRYSSLTNANAATVMETLFASGRANGIALGGPVTSNDTFAGTDQTQNLVFDAGVPDTAAHVFCVLENGSSSVVYVDLITTTGTLLNSALTGGDQNDLGSNQNPAAFLFHGQIFADLMIAGQPSSGARTTNVTILKKVAGIP